MCYVQNFLASKPLKLDSTAKADTSKPIATFCWRCSRETRWSSPMPTCSFSLLCHGIRMWMRIPIYLYGHAVYTHRPRCPVYINKLLNVCIYMLSMYIHACMHACMHAYRHTCIHADMQTCRHTNIRTYIYIHTQIYTHTHTCI